MNKEIINQIKKAGNIHWVATVDEIVKYVESKTYQFLSYQEAMECFSRAKSNY